MHASHYEVWRRQWSEPIIQPLDSVLATHNSGNDKEIGSNFNRRSSQPTSTSFRSALANYWLTTVMAACNSTNLYKSHQLLHLSCQHLRFDSGWRSLPRALSIRLPLQVVLTTIVTVRQKKRLSGFLERKFHRSANFSTPAAAAATTSVEQ